MGDITSEHFEKLEESVSEKNRGVIETHDFCKPDELYNELIKRIKLYHPNTDISIVDKAYLLGKKSHGNQKRKSGEPYIIHPLCVAIILADLEMDKETIIAGLLHDAVEDTDVTKEDLEKDFSPEIASLVDGVTKLGQLSYDADTVEVQAENLRKMFLAMAKDIRVIIIKLADRLHNMRTLKYMAPHKQKEKARETMEIYAPLAQRLGISKVKSELDDLSLKYLEPQAYYDLVESIALRKKERDDYVQVLVKEVSAHIKDAGIEAEIAGRAKHFFSIYKKMVNQQKTLDQIYDLFAIRIIVESVKDCYASLGVIHEMYTPIPGRFKDYIAMPKPNMYQSLHTSVIGPNGSPFEIQIRTKDMHRTSEYGIAAHWKYKESGEGSTINQEEAKLSWLRQILEWQRDMSDNHEFVRLLKDDLNLFSDAVFCFTPRGDVKNLPNGSTPIDFAYSIHSAVGNKMVGAKVNGRLVPIDYVIKNGDRIDILTSQNSNGPSRDWLKVVKSTQAKNKINQWFRSVYKEENISKGKELLSENAKAKGVLLSEVNKSKYQALIQRRYGFHDWDSVLAAIGQGSLKEGQVVNRLHDAYLKDHPVKVTDSEILSNIDNKKNNTSNVTKSQNGIIVRGLLDVSVRFSKCCSPLPGDEIVGFITRGRGVSVHRTDCVNIIHLPDIEKNRLIECEWENVVSDNEPMGSYQVELHIYANNRTGLVVDISKIFTEKNIDIQSFHSRSNKNGVATLEASFCVKSRKELQQIIDKIRLVDSVIDIERGTG